MGSSLRAPILVDAVKSKDVSFTGATSSKRREALQSEVKYRKISTAFDRRTYDTATTSS